MEVTREGDFAVVQFGVHLPRPTAEGKTMELAPKGVARQLFLHLVQWTPLDPWVEVEDDNGELAPIFQDTQLVLGWSPPNPGPQERAWLMSEHQLKAVSARTQRKRKA